MSGGLGVPTARARRLLAVIASTALLALALASCTGADGIEQADDGRFAFRTYGYSSCSVITDTETGVQYLLVRCANGGGLTVLVDGDGKPILEEGAGE